MDKIGHLKRLLHGRKRKRMRLAMFDQVKDLESLLAAKKLPDYTDPLDFNQLRDEDGIPFKNAPAPDRAAFRTMKDWMGIPINLNPIVDTTKRQPNAWKTLLQDTYISSPNPIPMATQLHVAMQTLFSFHEFERCRHHLTTPLVS
jgi:hypothetical protein